MRDQAERLRKIVERTHESTVLEQDSEPFCAQNARVITVTSGKGGVGKTNLVVNLALSLIEMGKRVVILDADFGLANIEVILGTIPQYNLLDVIRNKRNLLEVISNGPNNIRFISGGSGVEELSRLSTGDLQNFVKNINFLDRLFDVILVDTGAGVSDSVLSMVLAADEVILVTTPEPTAVTDAYALVKMIAGRDDKKRIKVIVNGSENEVEAVKVFKKLNDVTVRFVGMGLQLLGFLAQDETVKKAVRLQQPFVLSFPMSKVSRQTREISRKILVQDGYCDMMDVDGGVKGFFDRVVKFMSI